MRMTALDGVVVMAYNEEVALFLIRPDMAFMHHKNSVFYPRHLFQSSFFILTQMGKG